MISSIQKNMRQVDVPFDHELLKNVAIGSTYEHYSGKKYQIIALARDTLTLETLIVYRGLYSCSHYGPFPVWSRSLNEFLEMVVVDNQELPRFKQIESTSLINQIVE